MQESSNPPQRFTVRWVDPETGEFRFAKGMNWMDAYDFQRILRDHHLKSDIYPDWKTLKRIGE